MYITTWRRVSALFLASLPIQLQRGSWQKQAVETTSMIEAIILILVQSLVNNMESRSSEVHTYPTEQQVKPNTALSPGACCCMISFCPFCASKSLSLSCDCSESYTCRSWSSCFFTSVPLASDLGLSNFAFILSSFNLTTPSFNFRLPWLFGRVFLLELRP